MSAAVNKTLPAGAVVSEKKVVKSAKKVVKPSTHPKYSQMIEAALKTLAERNGSSRQAIHKYIISNFKINADKTFLAHLKLALKRSVENGSLKRVKGTGASGSFKISKKSLEGEKKVKKTIKKKSAAAKKKPATAAKKTVKKPAAKKATATKNVAVKAAAKPKKVAEKKSKAKKVAVKPKSPKKAIAKKVVKKVKPPTQKKAAPKAK